MAAQLSPERVTLRYSLERDIAGVEEVNLGFPPRSQFAGVATLLSSWENPQSGDYFTRM